jgi:signal transduction histidine kinase
MLLKTKLVLAITALVVLISGVVSIVYVDQLLDAAVKQTEQTNRMVANQVRLSLQQALEEGLQGRTVDPNDPNQLHALAVDAIRQSAPLQGLLDSVNRYSLTVYDINIGDSSGRIIDSTNPDNEDKPLPSRPDYKKLLNAGAVERYRMVFGPPQVFDVALSIERNGAPFVTVHVGARTTLLRAAYEPWLQKALTLTGFALGTALLMAFLLSNLALRPLEEISRQLDFWTAPSGENEDSKEAPNQDTVQVVSTKIEKIGQRMRNVEEVFSALKENLDQILGNLQDGLLLFSKDGRAVLVSQAARRFLHIERGHLLGQSAMEIFDEFTVLGRTLREAFAAGQPLAQQEVQTETGRLVEVSLDFIHDSDTQEGLGALVTLHDLESVQEIETELELSRRMAAIGRLTSGVGHEVKNPINAIVVHLELLKNKLGDGNTGAARHLEVIDAEIHRLDRVVQTLVDFSRPVELQLREQDLRQVVGDVLALSAEELSTRKVTLVSALPSNPVPVNVDADLLKQAMINIVQNGAQAMPEGGHLRVALEDDRKHAVLRIADEGTGIPDEIRDKIFDLYFTTKSEGSGIGLAMTYRIVQLHHGSIEVESEVNRGTEFVLRIPLATAEWARRHAQTAATEDREGSLQ